jgi:sodium-dependent dicarboxylate transporter 2/3/5
MLARLDSKKERATFVFVLLGIAYSASIGGIGTLVGSPPNAIAAAQMGIGFTDWMKFGVPVVLILMPCGIALLYLVTRPRLSHRVEIQDVTINWTRERKVTLAIFLTTVVLWIGSQPISNAFGGIPQLDTLIAMGAIVAIVVSRVASWDDVNQNTDWGVLMLFGGGLTLSAILKATGTSAFLASHLSAVLSNANIFVVLLMLAAFVVFLTELVSNTATAALLVPLFAGVAEALGVSPVVMSVLIAIGASCAFMLPVATPPNAIVFASGHIRQREMMKAGMALNVVFTVLLALLAYFVGDIL